MGMLSDFVIVDPSEIPTRFPNWLQPTPDWRPSDEGSLPDLDGLDVLESKGISPVTLDKLLKALQVGLVVDSVDGAFCSPSAEQFLTVLPSVAVEAIAALKGATFESWIEAFVAADRKDIASIKDDFSRESRLAFCTRDSWAPVLESLVELARRCKPPNVLALLNSV